MFVSFGSGSDSVVCLLSVRMPMKSSSERVGYVVCLASRYSLLFWSPKQLKNSRPMMLRLQICHARDDVEVDVREAFGFGELDDVGFGATGHAPQNPGELDLPHP
jgi:hypothetical protein